MSRQQISRRALAQRLIYLRSLNSRGLSMPPTIWRFENEPKSSLPNQQRLLGHLLQSLFNGLGEQVCQLRVVRILFAMDYQRALVDQVGSVCDQLFSILRAVDRLTNVPNEIVNDHELVASIRQAISASGLVTDQR